MGKFWRAHAANSRIMHDALAIQPAQQIFNAGEGARAGGVARAVHGFLGHPGAKIAQGRAR